MAAISCDPNDLLAAAKCFGERIPQGQQAAVQTYILDQLRIQGGGAPMTVDELVAAAKCYRCADGMLMEIQTLILCDLANQ